MPKASWFIAEHSLMQAVLSIPETFIRVWGVTTGCISVCFTASMLADTCQNSMTPGHSEECANWSLRTIRVMMHIVAYRGKQTQSNCLISTGDQL